MDDINGAVALARTWVARYREKHPGPGPFDPDYDRLFLEADMHRELRAANTPEKQVDFVAAGVLVGRWLRGQYTPVPEQETSGG